MTLPELPPVVLPDSEADDAFKARLAAALDSADRAEAAALARIAIQERIDASFPPYSGKATGYLAYEWHRECLADVLTHLVRSFGLLAELSAPGADARTRGRRSTLPDFTYFPENPLLRPTLRLVASSVPPATATI